MSYFASELELLIKEKHVRPADISRITGIAESALSRIRNGVQIWVAGDDIEKIASAIGPSAMIHARLLRAHLMDELSGPGKDLIDIEIRGKKRPDALNEDAPFYKTKLPPDLRSATIVFAKHWATDADLRGTIRGLKNLYEKEQLPD